MKGIILSLVLSNALFLIGYAQTSKEDSLEREKFLTLVNANREQSYITFGSGIGNPEPLVFEARLSPSYFFSRTQKRWAIMVNPQVQIRVLNRKSLPIHNPSYRVYVTFFQELEFWKNSFLRKIFYENVLWYGSYAHHSNGQDGAFFVENSNFVNLEDANFTTDFFELGISSYSLETLGRDHYSMREVKLSFEYHPWQWATPELKSRYGFYRLFVKLGILGPHKENIGKANVLKWLQRSSIDIKTGWIFGEMEGAGFTEASKRLIVDVIYKYYPNWLDEFAFFVRFYRGQDYYNIHFVENELSVVTFGLTSNIVNYKQAVQLFNGKK